MRSYRYLHYDVFTDTALEGNQLAVFPEPAGLTADDMQRVAREMNFSESTFVFPPEAAGTDVRMRILTPREELPMAGHPTVGTTFALAREGAIARGRQEFVFGLGVGPTRVSLEWRDDALDFVWMTQKNAEFAGAIADRGPFAGSLGLSLRDLGGPPPEVASSGNAFLMVPLASRGAVDRVEIDRAAYAACCTGAGMKEVPVFVFTTERGAGPEAVYSRMIAPGLGVNEDPATGSAAGPLGCYLHRHRLLSRERLARFVILQGVTMLRPSRLHVSIDTTGDEVTRVRVGGRSVPVGEGHLTF